MSDRRTVVSTNNKGKRSRSSILKRTLNNSDDDLADGIGVLGNGGRAKRVSFARTYKYKEFIKDSDLLTLRSESTDVGSSVQAQADFACVSTGCDMSIVTPSVTPVVKTAATSFRLNLAVGNMTLYNSVAMDVVGDSTLMTSIVTTNSAMATVATANADDEAEENSIDENDSFSKFLASSVMNGHGQVVNSVPSAVAEEGDVIDHAEQVRRDFLARHAQQLAERILPMPSYSSDTSGSDASKVAGVGGGLNTSSSSSSARSGDSMVLSVTGNAHNQNDSVIERCQELEELFNSTIGTVVGIRPSLLSADAAADSILALERSLFGGGGGGMDMTLMASGSEDESVSQADDYGGHIVGPVAVDEILVPTVASSTGIYKSIATHNDNKANNNTILLTPPQYHESHRSAAVANFEESRCFTTMDITMMAGPEDSSDFERFGENYATPYKEIDTGFTGKHSLIDCNECDPSPIEFQASDKEVGTSHVAKTGPKYFSSEKYVYGLNGTILELRGVDGVVEGWEKSCQLARGDPVASDRMSIESGDLASPILSIKTPPKEEISVRITTSALERSLFGVFDSTQSSRQKEDVCKVSDAAVAEPLKTALTIAAESTPSSIIANVVAFIIPDATVPIVDAGSSLAASFAADAASLSAGAPVVAASFTVNGSTVTPSAVFAANEKFAPNATFAIENFSTPLLPAVDSTGLSSNVSISDAANQSKVNFSQSSAIGNNSKKLIESVLKSSDKPLDWGLQNQLATGSDIKISNGICFKGLEAEQEITHLSPGHQPIDLAEPAAPQKIFESSGPQPSKLMSIDVVGDKSLSSFLLDLPQLEKSRLTSSSVSPYRKLFSATNEDPTASPLLSLPSKKWHSQVTAEEAAKTELETLSLMQHASEDLMRRLLMSAAGPTVVHFTERMRALLGEGGEHGDRGQAPPAKICRQIAQRFIEECERWLADVAAGGEVSEIATGGEAGKHGAGERLADAACRVVTDGLPELLRAMNMPSRYLSLKTELCSRLMQRTRKIYLEQAQALLEIELDSVLDAARADSALQSLAASRRFGSRPRHHRRQSEALPIPPPVRVEPPKLIRQFSAVEYSVQQDEEPARLTLSYLNCRLRLDCSVRLAYAQATQQQQLPTPYVRSGATPCEPPPPRQNVIVDDFVCLIWHDGCTGPYQSFLPLLQSVACLLYASLHYACRSSGLELAAFERRAYAVVKPVYLLLLEFLRLRRIPCQVDMKCLGDASAAFQFTVMNWSEPANPGDICRLALRIVLPDVEKFFAASHTTASAQSDPLLHVGSEPGDFTVSVEQSDGLFARIDADSLIPSLAARINSDRRRFLTGCYLECQDCIDRRTVSGSIGADGT